MGREVNRSCDTEKASAAFCGGHVESRTLKFLLEDTSDAALVRWNRSLRTVTSSCRTAKTCRRKSKAGGIILDFAFRLKAFPSKLAAL